MGATPFWRAAYASDIDAMKLLVSRGADPNDSRPMKGLGRPPTDDGQREYKDVSAVPPIPMGGPACRRSSPRPASATARALPATPTTSRRPG